MHVHHYQTSVLPQGSAPIQPLPETTLGNFQRAHIGRRIHPDGRNVVRLADAPGGSHLFKVGLDLLRNDMTARA